MKGSIRQRSKGSWEIRYAISDPQSGKRRHFGETVTGSKKEAERVLRERITSVEDGSYVVRNKETVSEFLSVWLDTYAVSNVSVRTLHGYRGYINRYIDTTIGKIPIQSLTVRHVQQVYSGMLVKGLSHTTVVQLHRIFRQALSHAVRWGILTRNVADATSPPRIHHKSITMWDVDTIQRFLACSKGSKYQHMYHLAILTGMRRSELTGLKWENVDTLRCVLSVVNTLQKIVGQGLVEGEPKTSKSRRSIALAQDAIDVLHSIRGQQIEDQLAAGPLWERTGYVFTQKDGLPVYPDMPSREFARIVSRNNLPHLTFHGLRHAHATLALRAGVNLKVISERLGHSNISITADIYSHVLPGMQEEAARAVEGLLRSEK